MDLTDNHRVLHLGLVATRPGTVVAPCAYSVCVGWADVTLAAGTDSFRVWGNTEDPDEDHTFDGTLHVVVDFDGDAPADEREAGRQVHARYAAWLAQREDADWRLADYVIWSDPQDSERQNLVDCLPTAADLTPSAHCRECGYHSADEVTVWVWNDTGISCPKCEYENGHTTWLTESGTVVTVTYRDGVLVG